MSTREAGPCPVESGVEALQAVWYGGCGPDKNHGGELEKIRAHSRMSRYS